MGVCCALHDLGGGEAGTHHQPQMLGLLGAPHSHSLYRLQSPLLGEHTEFCFPLQHRNATWEVETIRCSCRTSILPPQPFLEIDYKFLRVDLKGTTWWEMVFKPY